VASGSVSDVAAAASWTDPPVLVALVVAILSLLGVLVSFWRLARHTQQVELQDQQIRLLQEHDLAAWLKNLQEYRSNHLRPLAQTIRKAYAAHVGTQTGVPPNWERAVQLAPWPPGLPLPDGETLQSWKARFGNQLNSEGDYLLRFAEAVYVPAGPGQPSEPRNRTSVLDPEEYDRIDDARRGVADYFDACGTLAQKSDTFLRFLDGRVRGNHAQNVKLIAYLEIALVRALPEGSQPGPGKPGLFWLGSRWCPLA